MDDKVVERVRIPTGRVAPGARPAGDAPERRTRRRIPLPNLRLTSSERRWMLAVVDLVFVNGALLAALALNYDYAFSPSTILQAPNYFVLLSVVWLAWASFFDCYDLPRTADASQSAWSAVRAALLAALTYLAIPYLTPPFPVSRLSSLHFVVLLVVSVPLWRVLYARLFVQPAFQQRLLIVGAGRAGKALAGELAGTAHFGNPYAGSGFYLVGFVDDDPAKAGTEIGGVPVLGGRDDLARLIAKLKVDTVVVAVTHSSDIQPGTLKALLDAREQGVRLKMMTDLYERLTGRVAVGYAGGNLQVVVPSSESPAQRLFVIGKRAFDILAALVGMLVLGVLAPAIGLANAVLCPGPLFYTQTRVGRGGRPFELLKFRTMVPDAEGENGAVWAAAGDPRITPVGRLLRRTRLDELPQVWNILKGEMSLVGPRPERPAFVSLLTGELPFYQARHAVRPGLTGWAQVRYGYGSCVEDALVKLQYDLYYIKHQSIYLEASILAKTAAVMIRLGGR